MKNILQKMTDRIMTKKGVWFILLAWLLLAGVLAFLAPASSDYKVSSVAALPESAQSVIAKEKLDNYFPDLDGLPALLVFESQEGALDPDNLATRLQALDQEDLDSIQEMLPLWLIPADLIGTFFSDDFSAAVIPLNFMPGLDTKEIRASLDDIYETLEGDGYRLHITGPAGIALDTSALFSRADFVLLFSTVGIILILLIVTYRSPLLALIPLLAAAFVYAVVNQLLGFLGKSGLDLANQSLSIMMILLFALVIDYSLFIFSRFREELKREADKYMAMRLALREIGLPIFYSAATVFVAMLILLVAQFGDYRNFAPIFSTAIAVVMVSSVTLIPALFTIFGRRSFWPRVPQVGDPQGHGSGLWQRIAKFVTARPLWSIGLVGGFLLLSASNVLNISYEFNTMKSFPEDMPSRVGYDILEEKFSKGDLAPTTVLFEGDHPLAESEIGELLASLQDQPLVDQVQLDERTSDDQVVSLRLTFSEGPYEVETLDALDALRDRAADIVKESGLSGSLHFAGETAKAADDRLVNKRDLVLIVLLETIFIFTMLIFLTRSFRMPIYMMGTILLSFVAALGLGMFLSQLFFGTEAISNRVPVYSFIFLVALGIDYNIFLVSRYMEERKKYSVKVAVERAISHTGGVISSAGIVLAATFAVLMTQPVEVLFVFGFIVAIGILLDTFLVRGFLLPSILLLFEKDEKGSDV